MFKSGKPPKWTPIEEPRRLPWDAGKYYRDVNSASYPTHPLEPAVVAIMKMCPTPIPADIVACASSIANLLRFVRGETSERPFRFLVEVVGETVHFIRRENSPKELIPDVRGYGHSFADAYTTWEKDVKRSVSHQRILKYRFGGIDLLVRFEGDGYINSSRNMGTSPKQTKSDPEELVKQLPHFDLGNAKSCGSKDSKLTVVDGGQAIPQDAIFDLKTRSVMVRDRDVLGEQLPRLWVAQIQQLVLAYHTKGLFEDQDIQIKNIKSDLEEWEDINQSSLGRLAALLNSIISFARGSKDGKIEVVCPDKDSLEIRQRLPGAGDAFSLAVKAKWEEWLHEGKSSTKRDVDNHSAEGTHRHLDCEEAGSDYDDATSTYSSDGGDLTACDAECGYCGRCMY